MTVTIFLLWPAFLLKDTPIIVSQSPVPLCRALERLDLRDQIPVVISGIYLHNYFYDPNEPSCELDVDPAICIEFAEDTRLPREFVELHKDSRVRATFQGILFGPTFDPQTNDPVIPTAARIAAASRSRHCANMYAAKLVVDTILDYERVPETMPWDGPTPQDQNIVNQPFPIEMRLPGYPKIARTLGAEGSVLVEIYVSEGAVTATRVQYGDPLLAEAVIDNVTTWRFESNLNTVLNVEFEFRLERRSSSRGTNPRYEMELPSFVRVIGTYRRW